MSLGADNTLEAVSAVYSGAEGELWELLMGQQIHIGGFKASMDLAERAQIGTGQQGVDLARWRGSPQGECQIAESVVWGRCSDPGEKPGQRRQKGEGASGETTG